MHGQLNVKFQRVYVVVILRRQNCVTERIFQVQERNAAAGGTQTTAECQTVHF
jgi:hypothetical protein